MRRLLVACAWTFVLSGAAAVAVEAAPRVAGFITKALADKSRPAEDAALDAARKPGELIAFAGVKPGQRIAELLPGGGYFARILADVVGPSGHVYAAAISDKAVERIRQVGGQHPNVTALQLVMASPALPGKLDLIWTTLNYHDLHDQGLTPEAFAKVDAAMFTALKPGGTFLIVDHAAAPGSGLRDTNTLHRIDPQSVKQEVEAAGFRPAGSSELLRNPRDDHTRPVFDPSIRRHTDQFILKFRKPG
jgi:predicted methyltransferase